jgi:ubiquinone/menaquinone biosynthesis C-methylase UbiE
MPLTVASTSPLPPRRRFEDFKPRSLDDCLDHMRAFFDSLAPTVDRWHRRNRGYHAFVEHEYRAVIPPGVRVLEVGCGTGDLLAALEPSVGVGIDLSPAMIELARAKHAREDLRFLAVPVERLELPGETFDAIVLSDLVGFLYDIRAVLGRLRDVCHPRTRLMMNLHSRLWQPILNAAARLDLKAWQPVLNWVTCEDLEGLLDLAGFGTVRVEKRILLPKRVPLLSSLCNRVLAPFFPFSHLCVANFLVARPLRAPFPADRPPRVSVIVPCRNEAGNIPQVVARVPDMGAGTELVFVEGGSSDDTLAACRAVQQQHPQRLIQVHTQTGTGKGDAVRIGFARATGEVLMILDADLTVPPEELGQFYEAIMGGQVELANGSRLVYAMDPDAMRFLNLIANKLFGQVFSWLLGQRVKDTLCGTKVLLRADWERIVAASPDLGRLDPFGDFDILFGAAGLGLRIRDIPVRYRGRTYGQTNIRRFRHGLLLLRMCVLALVRIKCR